MARLAIKVMPQSAIVRFICTDLSKFTIPENPPPTMMLRYTGCRSRTGFSSGESYQHGQKETVTLYATFYTPTDEPPWAALMAGWAYAKKSWEAWGRG